MEAAEIVTPFHYVPLHSAEAGRRFGRATGPMTVTDDVTDRLVRLPSFFSLAEGSGRVIDRALAYLSHS